MNMTDEQFAGFLRGVRRVDPEGQRKDIHVKQRGVIVEFPWDEFVLIKWDGSTEWDKVWDRRSKSFR